MPVRAAPSPVTAESPPPPSAWTTAVPPSRHALAAVTSPAALVASPVFTSPLTVASSTASAVRLNCGDKDRDPPSSYKCQTREAALSSNVIVPVCPPRILCSLAAAADGVAIFSGSCRGQPRVTCASKHSAIHLYAVSIVPTHQSVLLDLWKPDSDL